MSWQRQSQVLYQPTCCVLLASAIATFLVPLSTSVRGQQGNGEGTPASLLGKSTLPSGFNIALAALGGTIARVSSQYNDTDWAAKNLIDGLVFLSNKRTRGRSDCSPCGWAPGAKVLPQEVVFSFYKRRVAEIGAVIIDTVTRPTVEGKTEFLPKDVEIWTSTTGPDRGFSRIASAQLERKTAEQAVTFSPTPARYLKVRFLSNYGGEHTLVGEVKIIEMRDKGSSILTELPKNLALPELGGALVSFTSQHGRDGDVRSLTDGGTDTRGWRSKDHYLPQEFVFAFHGDRTALIKEVSVDPKTDYDPHTWPRVITVSVSTQSPVDGFEEVEKFTLDREPLEQAFPINRPARFVKLRILENFGGRYTSLGEIKLIESSAGDYKSVLLESPESRDIKRDDSGKAIDESGFAGEAEPNDTPSEANQLELGRFTKGLIEPLGEEDYFKFSNPERDRSVLTLELIGRPNIRTSITLLDPTGNAVKEFDPGRMPAQQEKFSWAVNSGDHFVKVTEPPVSIVLIWDTSGSMKRDIGDLELAVKTYLEQTRTSERLNLMRFNDKPEVLLSGFTTDVSQLKAATQEKFIARGGTAFYDAVSKGIELLEGVKGNRAIIVMTDGADTASRLNHPHFWRLLKEKRIRLYTIGLGDRMREYLRKFASTGKRILGHVALATNGRFFFARTSDELKGFYQQIAEELRTRSVYYLKAALSPGQGYLSVLSKGEHIAGISAPSQFELILDASGSMIYQHQKIHGRLKMDVAKDVMEQIIKDLPDDVKVALRVYGRRIREGRQGDCEDTELLFGFAKIDKDRLIRQVRRIRAKGTTPMAYSLRQVADDVGDSPGRKVVILVTDGKEECGGSPTEAVSYLQERGLDVQVQVVGFALAEQTAKEEMRRVAKLTGGCFYDSSDAKELRKATQQALAARYDVADAGGVKVASGTIGQGPIRVPEGIFTISVNAEEKPILVPDVHIVHNRLTEVEVKKEGQEITTNVQMLDESIQREPAIKADDVGCPTAKPAEPEFKASHSPLELVPDPRVQHAQELLKEVGLEPGPTDGVSGGKTKEAVRQFQRYNMKQEAPAGKLDDLTYTALQRAANEGWRWKRTTFERSGEDARSRPKRRTFRRPAQPGQYRTITRATARVAPSDSAKEVARIPQGTILNVTGSKGDWLQVWSKTRKTMVYVKRDEAMYSGRQRRSSSALQRPEQAMKREILAALRRYGFTGVTVSFIGGTAYLKGQVETYEQWQQAAEAVLSLPGVQHVVNGVKISR